MVYLRRMFESWIFLFPVLCFQFLPIWLQRNNLCWDRNPPISLIKPSFQHFFVKSTFNTTTHKSCSSFAGIWGFLTKKLHFDLTKLWDFTKKLSISNFIPYLYLEVLSCSIADQMAVIYLHVHFSTHCLKKFREIGWQVTSKALFSNQRLLCSFAFTDVPEIWRRIIEIFPMISSQKLREFNLPPY